MEKVKLNAQERICTVIVFLYKNHTTGLTNKELAKLIKTSEANACRDIAVLESYQWVNRGAGNRWRLSPDFGGIAGQIMKSYQVARLLLSEEEAKYATAMQ